MYLKKLNLIVATLMTTTAICGGALAADPVQDFGHDWSGFYIGAHVGYGEADVHGKYTGDPGDDFLLDNGGNFDLELNSIVGGIQAGHNWQMGNIVLGVEMDATLVDWSDKLINGSGELVSAETDFVATLRGRAGLAVDNLLIFGTAGLAVTDTEYYANDHTDSTSSDEFGSRRLNDFGFVVGGGAEYAFDENWSIKAEGLYFIFNDKQDASSLTHDSEAGDFAELDNAWMVRIGVNFHF